MQGGILRSTASIQRVVHLKYTERGYLKVLHWSFYKTKWTGLAGAITSPELHMNHMNWIVAFWRSNQVKQDTNFSFSQTECNVHKWILDQRESILKGWGTDKVPLFWWKGHISPLIFKRYIFSLPVLKLGQLTPRSN